MWAVLLLLLAQAADYVAQGDKALEAKQFSQAIDFYNQAIAADPNDFTAEFQLGLAYNLQNKYAEAVPHYQRVLALKPGLYQAELNLGLSQLRAHESAAAVAHLEDAAREKPQEFLPALYLAQALLESGQYPQAEAAFKKALAINPPSQPAQTGLAESQVHQREIAQTAQNHRLDEARQLVESKQLDKAEAAVAPLVAARPDDLELRLFYARILRDERKFPDAASQFGAVVQRKPDSAEAWSELANLYEIQEQYAQTLAALDRVRALNAETPGHIFSRAIALDHLKQWPQAIDCYKQFLTLSQGKFSNQEFQARQRIKTLEAAERRR